MLTVVNVPTSAVLRYGEKLNFGDCFRIRQRVYSVVFIGDGWIASNTAITNLIKLPVQVKLI